MTIRKSILALAFAASCAMATLPSTMLFQGYVTLPAADANGSKELTVSLYDAETGGSPVWSDNFQNVVFTDGRFVVQLGSGAALPAFDKPLYIQLTVGTLVAASRTPLTLAPYAKRAAVAETAEALVSAADKSVALKDGNGTTQLTLKPDGGIQLKGFASDPGHLLGACNEQNSGRMVYVQHYSSYGAELAICMGTADVGYGWQKITTTNW